MFKWVDGARVCALSGLFIIGIGASVASCSSAGSDEQTSSSALERRPASESARARALLDAARGRFTFERLTPPKDGDLGRTEWTTALVPELPPGAAEFDETDQALIPRLPARGEVEPSLRLGKTAAESFALSEETTGVSVAVALKGARAAKAEVAQGYVVYPGALGSGDDRSDVPHGTVVARPHADGLEDYVLFDKAPGSPEVSYDVQLGKKVAGLRFVASTLEFLDATGAPRLRMSPPWITDAAGVRHVAKATVSGCAYDENPVAPWGRPVTAPGAERCTVRVSWDANISYPALLDPQWVLTTNLLTARAAHTVTPYKSGTTILLLVVGGRASAAALGNVEIYNPGANPPSTAATNGLIVPRMGHTATYHENEEKAPFKRVLVTGGTTTVAGTALRNTEYYDISTGTWSGLTDCSSNDARFCMTTAREGHTATGIPNTIHTPIPGVFVVGGRPSNGGTPIKSAEYYAYDSTILAFRWFTSWGGAPIPDLGTGRYAHGATMFRVSVPQEAWNEPHILVAGGVGANDTFLKTAQHYYWDPTDKIVITPVPDMGSARAYFSLNTIDNDKTVAIGGLNAMGSPNNTAEVYQQNAWTAVTGTLTAGNHASKSQVVRSLNRILVTHGGYSDIYDSGSNTLYPASPLVTARTNHEMPLVTRFVAQPTMNQSWQFDMPYGLVLGGIGVSSNFLNSVEKWTSQANGGSCQKAGDCTYLSCQDSYCCNAACNNPCDVCNLTPGVCTPAPDGSSNPACGAYLCNGSSPSCPGPGSCASDADCVPPNYCNASGNCTAPKSQGTLCNAQAGADCKVANCGVCTGGPGRCADGVCCNTACGGECDRCNLSVPGTCAVVSDGTAGDPACSGFLLCTNTSASCPTACATNADCISGYYCDQTSTPKSCKKQDKGTPCSTGGDCSAPFQYCANSVCCDSACTGGCSACNLSGKLGTCSAVAPGTPPSPAACPSSGGYLCNGTDLGCPTSCLSDNNCASGYYCASDSKCMPKKLQGSSCNSGVGGDCKVAGCGICASGNCVDGVCCDTTCSGACDACNLTGLVGTCSPVGAGQPGNPSCAPYECGAGTACATTCTGNPDCANGYYCDTTVSQCKQQSGVGATCANQSECGAGLFCVDNVCCTTDCTGSCVACSAAKKGSGSNGFCGPIAGNTDPDAECADTASSTCGTSGTCDGSGKCSLWPSGTGCSPGTSCTAGQQTNYQCNGLGACLAAQTTSCSPYICAGSVCGTTCAGDTDCAGATYCNTSVTPKKCEPLKPKGSSCSSNNQCGTGNCVDGYCCDTACAGGCDRCDQAGALGDCTTLGVGATPSASCPSSTGYLCSGSSPACPTTCVNDSNCAAGYYCGSDAKCKPKKSQGANCNTGVGGDCAVSGCSVCTTGNCVDGVCCNSACSGQCDACNIAGSIGTCAPAGAGTPGSPSCSPYECSASSVCATSCTASTDCAQGYFCDTASNQCQPQTQLGTPCTTQAQCGSNLYCVDGVCCASDCLGLCMACSAAKKGQGTDGLCDNVAAGLDPDGSCSDQGAVTCGTTGSCDGTGKCSVYPSGTACGTNTSCTAGQQTSYQCNGLGQCQGTNTTLCTPYVCSGATCGSSCADDTACAQGYFCNTGTNKCVGKQALGVSCTANAQCSSGFCVDGFCCDKACTGPCYACSKAKKGAGDDGICDPVVKGSDPDNECAADPVSTCQKSGTCDGAGSCGLYAQGTACGSVTCVGNSAVGKVCNAFNECKDDTTGVACAPYLCASAGCPSTCADSTQCTTGFYCASNTCVAKKQKGAACGADAECTTGFCADGYCCNTACGGQCEACDAAGNLGTCGPISGAPHANKPPCTGTGACAGTCDGLSPTTCTYPDSTKLCEGSACEGSVFKPNVCNSQGQCVAGQSKDCGNYACDSTAQACKTACTTSADCASGSQCNTTTGQCAAIGATCKDAFTVVTAGGQEQSCAPYKCVGGACQQQCTSSGDCAPGYECSGTQCLKPAADAGTDAGKDAGTGGTGGTGDSGTDSGTAGTPPDAGAEDGGCGCATPRSSTSGAWLLVAGLGLALGLGRRGSSRAGRGSRAMRNLPS